MKLNRYLTSTLLAGFCVGALTFTPAMGAEQSLQPSGLWTVTKIDKGDEKNAYCTLSRKYDGGVILSLARNQTEEYSLAFDFQKPNFDKGKSVKVSLQPGPGQARTYNMMPTSEQAMVIRLGWDDGFFKALSQSQQMKVKLGEKQYSFATPQIVKGQSELQNCMEELKAAKKDTARKTASSGKDVLNAEPVAVSKAFSAGKIEEEGVVAGTMTKETSPAKQVKDNIPPPVNLAQDEASAVEKRRNFAKVVKEESDEKPVKAEKIAEAKADHVPRAPSAKPEIEVPSFAPAPQKSREEKVQQSFAEAAVPNVEGSQADKKRIETLQGEIKALREQIDLAKAESAKKADPAAVEKIKARAEALEIKNAQLEDSLRKSQIRIGETAINTETKSLRTIADLQVKLDASQKDNAQLAKQLDDLRLKQETTAVAAVSGNGGLEQATKRYNEAEREIRRLAQQNEEQQQACSIEKTKLEQMLFDPAVTDKKQIEKLSSLQHELEDAKAKLASQDKIVKERVYEQVAANTRTLDAEKKTYSDKIASLQKAISDKDAALAAAQSAPKVDAESAKKLADVQSTLVDMKQNNDALRAQNNYLRGEAEKLNSQLASIQAQQAGAANQSASVKHELETLKNQLTSKEAQAVAVQSQLIAIQQENAQFKARISSADAAGSMAASQLQALQKENADLKARMASVDTASGAAKMQLSQLSTQVQSLQQENVQLKTRISSTDAAGSMAASQLQALQKENADLKARMASASSMGGATQAQLSQLSLQLQTLQQENAQLKGRLASSAGSAVMPAPVSSAAPLSRVPAVKNPQPPMQMPVSSLSAEPAVRKTADEAVAIATQYGSLQPAAGASLTAGAVSYAKPSATAPSAALKPVALTAPSAMAPVAPMAIIPAAPAVPAARVVAPVSMVPSVPSVPSSTSTGYTVGTVQGLLQRAGISAGMIQQIPGGVPGADAFSWVDNGNVRGYASVQMMAGGNFDTLVNQYIAYQKSQCGGDYASMPSPSNSGANKRMALYEIACVGPQQNLSSSVIFFEDQGRFIAISNQIDAADMDLAMDSRDRIATFVRSL